jgi:Golgi nucleoside diphosphatase
MSVYTYVRVYVYLCNYVCMCVSASCRNCVHMYACVCCETDGMMDSESMVGSSTAEFWF